MCDGGGVNSNCKVNCGGPIVVGTHVNREDTQLTIVVTRCCRNVATHIGSKPRLHQVVHSSARCGTSTGGAVDVATGAMAKLLWIIWTLRLAVHRLPTIMAEFLLENAIVDIVTKLGASKAATMLRRALPPRPRDVSLKVGIKHMLCADELVSNVETTLHASLTAALPPALRLNALGTASSTAGRSVVQTSCGSCAQGRTSQRRLDICRWPSWPATRGQRDSFHCDQLFAQLRDALSRRGRTDSPPTNHPHPSRSRRRQKQQHRHNRNHTQHISGHKMGMVTAIFSESRLSQTHEQRSRLDTACNNVR